MVSRLSSGFAPAVIHTALRYDVLANQLWATKPVGISLYRVSGSHSDFPFDSAEFEFDMTYSPVVPINYVGVRDRNAGFGIGCGSLKVKRKAPGVVHIQFEARRNPLVQLTAIVLVLAGLIFLLVIVFVVKVESLPTSVASFFFSLWSIRAIMASQLRTFPTILDLAVLSLCALFLVLLGIRLAIRQIRADSPQQGSTLTRQADSD